MSVNIRALTVTGIIDMCWIRLGVQPSSSELRRR